jgi:carboxy-cis,cis-muconate cyclase
LKRTDRDRHSYRGDTLRFGVHAAANGSLPLIASTRGKTPATRGFVAVWTVDPSTGLLSPSDDDVVRFETSTSGGKANAVEPAFWAPEGKEVFILTDDDHGWVSVLEYDGRAISVVDSVKLPGRTADGVEEGASHAVWLS